MSGARKRGAAVVVPVAVALLLAGCKKSGGEAQAPATTAPATGAASSSGAAATTAAPRPKGLVWVVDGDLGTRVAGARVSVPGDDSATGPKGLARVVLPRQGAIRVEVRAPGYMPKEVRLRFGDGASHTVAIYRPELQWPFYGATDGRTQAQPAIRIRPPFRVVWSRGVGSLVEFPAIVWEGVAYVNTLEGALYAISMRDGAVLWKVQVGTKTASSPAVDPASGSLVVTTMEPGDVQIRDLATGKLEWHASTGLTEPSPVVRDGIAYFAATDGTVYALDVEQRHFLWRFSGGSKITSSPALAGGRVYVGDYAGNVYCLDASSGKLVWRGDGGTHIYGTVAVAGGRVFAPSVEAGLTALSAASGEELWRIPTSSYLYSSPAVYHGRVYFANYAGTVYSASAASGHVYWSASAGGSVSGALEVVDGVVYAGSFGGVITGWNWRTGHQLLRFPHGEYVPVSGNGGRLLLHGFSRIYAVEPKHGSPGS